jgi:hypothetical protein
MFIPDPDPTTTKKEAKRFETIDKVFLTQKIVTKLSENMGWIQMQWSKRHWILGLPESWLPVLIFQIFRISTVPVPMVHN